MSPVWIRPEKLAVVRCEKSPADGAWVTSADGMKERSTAQASGSRKISAARVPPVTYRANPVRPRSRPRPAPDEPAAPAVRGPREVWGAYAREAAVIAWPAA